MLRHVVNGLRHLRSTLHVERQVFRLSAGVLIPELGQFPFLIGKLFFQLRCLLGDEV